MSVENKSIIDVMNEWNEQIPKLNLFRAAKKLTDHNYKPDDSEQPEYYNDKGESVNVRDWHIVIDDRPEFEELRSMGVEDVSMIHIPRLFYRGMVFGENMSVFVHKSGDELHAVTGIKMQMPVDGTVDLSVDFEGLRHDGSTDYRSASNRDIRDAQSVLDALKRSQSVE